MINWAIVPTTISESAVDMRSQIESRLAIKREAQPQRRKGPNAGHLEISRSLPSRWRASRYASNYRHGGSGPALRTGAQDVFRHRSQDAQDSAGLATDFLLMLRIRMHSITVMATATKTETREAVICQQCSQTRPPHLTTHEHADAAFSATRTNLPAWCRGNRASSYRRQASGRESSASSAVAGELHPL